MGVTNGPDAVYAENADCGSSGMYRFIGDHIDWIESSSKISIQKIGDPNGLPKPGAYYVKNWDIVKGEDIVIPDGGSVDIPFRIDQNYTKDRLILMMKTSHPNPSDIAVHLLDENMRTHSYLIFGVRKSNQAGLQPFSEEDVVPQGNWTIRVLDTKANGKSGVIKSMFFKLEAIK